MQKKGIVLQPSKFISYMQSQYRVQGKVLGDSITAGVASEGYFLTEEAIGKTGRFVASQTSTCWTNLFNRQVETLFQGETFLSIQDAQAQFTSTWQYKRMFYAGSAALFLTTVEKTVLAEFQIETTEMNIYFTKQAGSGIVAIYLDDVLYCQEDLYSKEELNQFKIEIRNLSDKQHNIKIKLVGWNPQSASSRIYFEGITIPKKVSFKNWAITGATAEFLRYYIGDLIEEEDTLILIQIGTNDRLLPNKHQLKNNLMAIIDYILEQGKDILLLGSIPMSDNTENLNFTTAEVNVILKETAKLYNSELIDCHNFFKKLEKNGQLILGDEFLDEIHPTQKVHQKLYECIWQALELPI